MDRRTNRGAQASRRATGGTLTERARRPLGAMVSTAAVAAGIVFTFSPVPIARAALIEVTSTGIASGGNGTCELTEAIFNANSNTASQPDCEGGGLGLDLIIFNLPGPGPFVIEPDAPLPPITDALIIDGTSQPGWVLGGPPVVEISNASASGGGDILDFSATTGSGVFGLSLHTAESIRTAIVAGDNMTIRSNWIGIDTTQVNPISPSVSNGFGVRIDGKVNVNVDRNVISGNDQAITVSGSVSGLQIQNNLIGTNAAGTATIGNNQGITITGAAIGTQIVGNVISGNAAASVSYAINIDGPAAGTSIRSNSIGTDVNGSAALANDVGVSVAGGATGTVIGAPGGGNIISGNNGEAIALWDTVGTTIQSNVIGVGADGTSSRPNNVSPTVDGPEVPGFGNIVLRNGASDTLIGGEPSVTVGNIIANSPFAGVRVFSGTGNEIAGNRSFDNGGLDIDLGVGPALDGPTPNDPLDADAGANNLQNAPTIVSAEIVADDVFVEASIDSAVTNSAYPIRIDVYRWDFFGRTYLGSAVAAAPGSAFFSGNTDALSVSLGTTLTATATDANGNTSEFGPSRAVAGPNTFVVNRTDDFGDLVIDGSCIAADDTDWCTLRAAIEEANATLAPDTILFDFPGTSVVTIAPATDLPTITGPLTIDGIVGTGATCGPDFAAGLRVELAPTDGFAALVTSPTGVLTLRGLVINGASSHGLFLDGNGNRLECNYFGTNAAGTLPAGARQIGVFLNGSDSNLIGGPAGKGNVFAGFHALEHLRVADSDSNVIEGNWFGSSPFSGGVIGGDADNAIFVSGDDNRIGGLAAGEGNVIVGGAIGAAIQVGVDLPASQPVGNTIRGNRITGNGGLGIDLAGNGVTFNHEGLIAGPNRFQNFPVLTFATSASGGPTRVGGYVDGVPSRTYGIDVFAAVACDSSGFGEGSAYLGSFLTTADASGRATFDATVPLGFGEPYGITTTATDGVTGDTSEFSYCRPASSTNVNWVQALPLSSGSAVSQYITNPLQEKWFRVPAGPGADVTVQLTSQPGFAVSLHSDPLEAYNAATNPTSAVALAAEAADVAFLPSGSLPSGSLPSGSLPSGSLPSGSLPSGSLEIGFLPSGSLPSGSLPSGSLPSGSLPSGSLPSGSLPSGSLPSGSLPSGSLPSGSLPSGSLPSGSLPSGSLPSGSLPSGSLPSGSLEAYGIASARSLVAWSANPYATVQTIQRNTFDRTGDVYVRVVGPFDLDDQFTIDIDVSGGVCSALAPIAQVDYATPAGSGRTTVILTDSSRMTGTPAEIAEAMADLGRFAARTDIGGVVIDLADPIYADVAAANAQADGLPNCALAKNVVAEEIKDLVDEFRIANPIEYVVIAGGADVVPFHQVSDVAGLANEREYIAPAAANSPTEAGLRSGLVKGQDFYGSSIELTVAGRTLAVPDLAVGRLVDGAADISAAIEAYEATGGVVTPSSSLVTGYDFVGDAAATIAADFQAGLGTAPTTLIQAPGEFPSAPSAWDADDLRTPLLSGSNDLVMLTGHFSAGKLLAADYRSTLLASEIQDGPTDFTDAIILALGCHGGFSLPSTDLIAGASPDPDWAKAFLRRGAASFVAATGYAYGDTELEEYGERLFIELARQMRTGTGPVSMGDALVLAKQAYLAQVPQLAGIDEKTIVEMTLYGLPMMKVDVPGARLAVPTSTSVVGSTAPVGAPATPGLSTATIEILPEFGTTQVVELDDLENGGTVSTRYTPGADGVVAIPFEPVLPKQLDDVSSAGNVLRGVAIRGGTYTDVGNIIPFTSAPTTETSRPIQSFQSDVFYPNQVFAPNFYAALDGGPTRLMTVPQQYRSDGVGSITGTVRNWTQVAYQLYYLPDTWNTGDPAIIEAGVGAAPSITGASADVAGDTVTFTVNAVAEGSAGVQSVWILYTGEPGSPFTGRWLPVDLVRDAVDPTVWTGTLPLGGADPSLVRFMVQAVGGAGLTTLSTNLGRYYRVGVDNAPAVSAPATTTSLTGPASGQRGAPQTFQATVSTGASPVSGGVVDFEIAGQRVQALTNASGVASITITPFAEPGTYEAQATLRGSSERRPSSDQTTFTVTLASTTLTLSPSASTASTLGSSGLVASLDSADGGLGGKPVVFTLVDGAGVYERVIITDAWGEAALGDTGLPPGTYTVTATFGGAADVDAPDPFFAGSTSGSATLVLEDSNAPTITASATVSGGSAYTAGTWTSSDVTVTFTCADRGGAGLASCTPPQTVTASGITAAVTGTAVDTSGLTTTTTFGPVQIDRTGPTITVTTPGAAATYPVGTIVNAAFSCTDPESGVATCVGTVATGSPIDTATAGAKSFVVTATDAVGNTSTTTVNYTVIASGNVAPTVVADMGVAGLQEIGFRGSAVLITGTYSDPDGRSPYRASVRWTPGGSFTPFAIAGDGKFAAAWIYSGAGTRTVTVRICDAQGLCGTDDVTVRTGISQRVTPVFQCVTDRGASTFLRYRANFGYDNPAPFAIAAYTFPLLENTFFPLPAFRGQPQVFLPGNQRNVFTADFRSGTLSWTLHGTTAVARTNSPRC